MNNHDTNDIMVLNITSDSMLISLTLATDITYSMPRVRLADRASRGRWSPQCNIIKVEIFATTISQSAILCVTNIRNGNNHCLRLNGFS